ncbi:MAG: hypothetical protein CVT49_13185 [candidate division Zixibacteria bacterium HGW-Zixibacteria-1]|nr:MAG: hypothetical protein CVT49_13185 [candidate division Zixibacteria bacterium HGW-Zixibacteria-1]
MDRNDVNAKAKDNGKIDLESSKNAQMPDYDSMMDHIKLLLGREQALGTEYTKSLLTFSTGWSSPKKMDT